jgi:putative aldouronate transport system substrate-binding protein
MKRNAFLLLLLALVLAGSLWGGGSSASSSKTASTGPVTLDYWLPIHVNAIKFIKSYAENEAYQEIQKRLGITVNFIHPASGAEAEQFNLMIASGELPDLIQSSNRYSGGVMKGVQDGIYLELSDKLQQYAPDYYKIINSTTDIRREFYDENGHIGAFYRVSPWPPAPVWMRAITRKDWLAEFGMKPPKTLDQYEAFFKAIQEKKPDAVPFYLPITGAGREAMYSAFNIWPNWFITDGKVRHGNADPVLKDYLTRMNDWYKKGYISKDFASITQQQVWSLFDTNKVAMYFDSVDSSGARCANLPFKIESCPLPRLAENSKLHLVLSSFRRSSDETSVAASSKKQEAALKFLNYGYSPEGAMIYNYGVEGKTYNMVNGKPVFTDYVMNNPLFTTENANYILKIHFAPKLGVSDLEGNPTVMKSPDSVAFRKQWSEDPNEDSIYKIPPISLTPAENTRRAEIMANVNTYTDEMILKFIIGTEPLSNFDKYMDQLNQYGMQEAVKITQAAYDRYMAKK